MIDTIHLALNAIETIFGFILDVLKPLLDWLGELIGIGSIKRTQEAMKFFAEESFDLLKRTAQFQIKSMKNSLAKASECVDKGIDEICKQLGSATPSSHSKNIQALSGRYDDSADNYLMDALRSGTDTIVLPPEFFESVQAPLDDLLTYLKTLSTRMQNEPAFKEALDYLKSISGIKDNFFGNALAAFLKGIAGVVKLVLSVVSDACEAVINLGIKALDSIYAILTAKLDIPVIRTLFKAVFTQDMTIMNIATLLIAMPINIISKIASGQVPFRNNDEVEKFKNECRTVLRGYPNTIAKNEVSEKTKKLCLSWGGLVKSWYTLPLWCVTVTLKTVKIYPKVKIAPA